MMLVFVAGYTFFIKPKFSWLPPQLDRTHHSVNLGTLLVIKSLGHAVYHGISG